MIFNMADRQKTKVIDLNQRQKTIVLLNGQSQYHVLRHFIQDLAAAFQQLGYHAEIVDLLRPSWPADLEKTVKERDVRLFLSMNAMGIDIKIGETALYDYLNIPLFAFLVDHPMYHLNRLNRGVKNLIVSCVDRTHVDFLKRFLNGEYTKVFIPHGAPFRPHPDSGRSVGKRNIDIFFAGTVFNPDSYREKWSAGGRSIARLYDEIMERYLSGHDRTLIMAAEDVFEERGIDTEYLNHYRFWENLVYVDLYVRNKRRLDVIQRISKLGLRIEIFGNGWEPYLDRHPSVKFNPSLPFERVQEKMADAKVVLNILPNFHEGGHERIFSAMLNGAVCLSSGNSYLRREFREGEDILFYAFGQDLEEVLGEYFNDEEKMQRIADNGRKKAMERHTWLQRAEKILETVEYHMFFVR